MFKTLWDDTTWQRLINYISNYRSNLIQTIMKNRGRDRVKVTRLFGISWSTSFTQSFVISLNSAKGVPENSTVSQGNGLSGSRLLLISSILRTKNSLNLSGRDSGGMFEGRTHQLIAKTEKLPGTITVYNSFTNIVFLGFTYQVWHHIALLCINLPMHS